MLGTCLRRTAYYRGPASSVLSNLHRPWRRPPSILRQLSCGYSISSRLQKNESFKSKSQQIQTAKETLSGQAEPIKPETVQRPPPAKAPSKPTQKDPLLSEQNLSNKEQRKADWAIMKEMAVYLWPKVGADRVSDYSQADSIGQPWDKISSRALYGITRWSKGRFV
jgi:hypothetical protein